MTSGFQLSQTSRGPRVPSNLGSVDVKGIYDSVVESLRAQEGMQSGMGRQAETEASQLFNTEKALTDRTLLQPEANARRAKAGLLASEATEAMAGVPDAAAAKRKRDILSSAESDAGMTLVGPKTEAEAEKAKAAAVGARVMQDPDLAKKLAENKSLTTKQRDNAAYLAVINDPTQPETARKAALIALGMEPKVLPDSFAYIDHVGADGVSRIIAVDRRAVGMRDPVTNEAVGSMATPRSAVGPTTPMQGAAAPAPTTPPVSAFSPTPPAATLAGDRTKAVQQAELQREREAKLPKAKATLEAMDAKTALVDNAIEEAKALTNNFTVGYGSLLDRLPMTDARKLAALITTIRANIGFDALSEMRQNSPTGGALGNVSDYEGKTLQAVIATLDSGMDPQSFKEALDKVKAARQNTLQRVRSAYSTDFSLAAGTPTSNAMTPQTAAPDAADLEARLKKYQ